MIYTMTFNPAIDYVMRIDTLRRGETNRSKSEEIQFGGKGINVSTVLANLGRETVALGFIAGFTGEALDRAVTGRGVRTDFIHLPEGNTRINVKLKSDKETEINAQGPVIPEAALESLYQKLDKIANGDTLVLARAGHPLCCRRHRRAFDQRVEIPSVFNQTESRRTRRDLREGAANG